MQPTYQPLGKIFGVETRYTVPLFQRPYVWTKEDQWEPLWDDISALAERLLETDVDKPVAGHFLGTIVLEQSTSRTGSIGRREIIDGQQRLTTLQILLKAAEHLLAETQIVLDPSDESAKKNVSVASRQIASLTANPAYAEDEEKYKVWPTNEDRAAFRQVMEAAKPLDLEPPTTRMAEAYGYFLGAIRIWLAQAGGGPARAIGLANALKDHVRLIVLDLDDTDEPQAIFETLNAHGTPLLPADLIKNWLLWAASRASVGDIASLYERHWGAFDKDATYWRQVVGTGHAARARVDTFLQNWLTLKTREAIATKHLYDRFLKFATPAESHHRHAPVDVARLMEDIHANSARFRHIQEPIGNSRFNTFLRRLSTLDLVVFHPVLLAVMGRVGSDMADKNAIAVVLESYLVRRMICWEQTRSYGALMLELLDAIEGVPENQPIAPVLQSKLASPAAESYRWPSDEDFMKAWCNNKFYKGYRRVRVQMVLEALEDYYQREGIKGEPIVSFDFSELQIEHILPQNWKKNWPLPKRKDAEKFREDRLHNIGNLTLVSGKLNPSLSHAPWIDAPNGKKGKRAALEEHSKLQLNARLVKQHIKGWNDDAIMIRAERLFEVAKKIWPRPPSKPEQ